MKKKSTRKISIETSTKLVTFLRGLDEGKRTALFQELFLLHGVELKLNPVGMLVVKASKPTSDLVYANLQALNKSKEAISIEKIFKAITTDSQIQDEQESEEFDGKIVLRHKNNHTTVVEPKTENQLKFISNILSHKVIYGLGSAGTGKTFIATAVALKMLEVRRISKIIISRPAVSAVEDIGYLPGSADEKLEPFMLPILAILAELIGRERRDELIQKGVIEILPLGFARGMTIGNRDGVIAIIDEAQNLTFSQHKLILTRLGSHPESKLIMAGDNRQSDLRTQEKDTLSLIDSILKKSKYYASVIFTNKDVVRSPVVQEILELIEDYEDGRKKNK